MELIAEFNDNQGLNVKLTKEKIFISATGNEETLALRGVNGVGVYDDIEKYNKEIEDFKKSSWTPKKRQIFSYSFIGLGILYFILGLTSGTAEGFGGGIIFFAVGIIVGKYKSKKKSPELDSYFRIILSGGDRKFKFNKTGDNAVNIAQFINKIEDTLTAYSK